MKLIDRDRILKLRGLLATGRPEPAQQAERIVKMMRDVVLPSKAGVCVVVLYYFFYSGWSSEEKNTVSVTLDTLKDFFLVYLACNFFGAVFFVSWRRLPTGLIQWLAFILGLLDGVFMGGLTVATGGFASIAFWVFPGLIVLNALTIPLAVPQIVLNLLLSIFYFSAVLWTPQIGLENTISDTEALANIASHAGRAQIATNLQSAASTATADGNTSAASQLNTLATDFTNASTSGQLPNMSDLTQAIGGGGGHHHHHGHHGSSSSSSTDATSSTDASSSTSTSSTSSTSPLSQLLAAFQSNATQNEQFDPLSIITNTLTTAGITGSNT